jgi:hypothetical protein
VLFLAVFGAAPQICNDVDATPVKPQPPVGAEEARRQRNAVPSDSRSRLSDGVVRLPRNGQAGRGLSRYGQFDGRKDFLL